MLRLLLNEIVANGVYLIAIINKTPLHNGNCPILDPTTKMGLAHTVGLGPGICVKYFSSQSLKNKMFTFQFWKDKIYTYIKKSHLALGQFHHLKIEK